MYFPRLPGSLAHCVLFPVLAFPSNSTPTSILWLRDGQSITHKHMNVEVST